MVTNLKFVTKERQARATKLPQQKGDYAELFFLIILILLEGEALVEGLGTFVAFGQEVEANTTDMLLGTEVLEVINLFAFYLEFHHAPVWQANTIALAQM